MASNRDLILLLKRLAIELRAFLEGQQKQIEAIAEYTKAQNKSEEPQPPRPPERVRNEVDFLPEAINRFYAEQDKTHTIQKRTFWISLLTLIALGIYTLYTIRMYGSNKEASDAARKAADVASDALDSNDISSFDNLIQMKDQSRVMRRNADMAQKALDVSIAASRNDQRAWLSIANVRLMAEPTAGMMMNVIYDVTNTGRTPAINATARSSIAIQPAEPEPPVWSTIRPANTAVIFPNSSSSNLRAPLVGIGQGAVDNYVARRANIYARMHIEYRDAFRKSHWVEVCMAHTSGEPLDRFQYCTVGGDIDRDEEQQPQQQR